VRKVSDLSRLRLPKRTDRSDDVHTEQSVGLLIAQHFDEPVNVVVGLGPGVGDERELSNLVVDPLQRRMYD
jgi:hypothetical protein